MSTKGDSFKFSMPGGGRLAPLTPVSYATANSASTGKITWPVRYLPFRMGSNGADLPFRNSIIGN